VLTALGHPADTGAAITAVTHRYQQAST
jgi:hypothetical protein